MCRSSQELNSQCCGVEVNSLSKTELCEHFRTEPGRKEHHPVDRELQEAVTKQNSYSSSDVHR